MTNHQSQKTNYGRDRKCFSLPHLSLRDGLVKFVVKKDRQPVLFYASLSQKYVTNILPNSLTNTTDPDSIDFTDNLA